MLLFSSEKIYWSCEPGHEFYSGGKGKGLGRLNYRCRRLGGFMRVMWLAIWMLWLVIINLNKTGFKTRTKDKTKNPLTSKGMITEGFWFASTRPNYITWEKTRDRSGNWKIEVQGLILVQWGAQRVSIWGANKPVRMIKLYFRDWGRWIYEWKIT